MHIASTVTNTLVIVNYVTEMNGSMQIIKWGTSKFLSYSIQKVTKLMKMFVI